MKEPTWLGAERNGAPETEGSVRSGGERLGAMRPPATEAVMVKGDDDVMGGEEESESGSHGWTGLGFSIIRICAFYGVLYFAFMNWISRFSLNLIMPRLILISHS